MLSSLQPNGNDSLFVHCNSQQEPENEDISTSNFMDQKALRMMQKMGYKEGSGLGKNEQGLRAAIEVTFNLGKRGLGNKLNNLNLSDEEWDFNKEKVVVEEKVDWLINTEDNIEVEDSWINEGPPNYDIENNPLFCNPQVLKDIFKAKNIFDEMNYQELCIARAKANPFETIRSAFFMNRAALKMANIDAATDFSFTNVDKSPHFSHSKGPFYFADVCAGPGGFTEYILWRKKWQFKGFGLTLRDDHDFKMSESLCASSDTFQALYGENEDGDVCRPENIKDFVSRVRNEIREEGLHFMMSDGGFSVDGNEGIQEILSKSIYACQCLVALELVRTHGHFVTKTFDVFTPFSIGLLFLMSRCFKKIGILKPNSSRPANSERYFICMNKYSDVKIKTIKEHLWKVVNRLWKLRDNPEVDIVEIVPCVILKSHENFYQYIYESNTRIAQCQIVALEKLAAFCRNPTLIDARQEQFRKMCLKYWRIPDKTRSVPEPFKVENLLSIVNLLPEILRVQPRVISTLKSLEDTVVSLDDWHYAPMFSSDNINRCNFYAGVENSKVYRLQGSKWVRVKDLKLVKGTFLYGEFVKESIKTTNEKTESAQRYSLHVIDALRLGDLNISDLSSEQRQEIIKVYCKAVNKESQSKYSVRVRPKIVKNLRSFTAKQRDIKYNNVQKTYFSTLRALGYQSLSETYEVKSVLLLKTNRYQSFQSTYVLRVQIIIDHEENQKEKKLSLRDIINYIDSKQ